MQTPAVFQNVCEKRNVGEQPCTFVDFTGMKEYAGLTIEPDRAPGLEPPLARA